MKSLMIVSVAFAASMFGCTESPLEGVQDDVRGGNLTERTLDESMAGSGAESLHDDPAAHTCAATQGWCYTTPRGGLTCMYGSESDYQVDGCFRYGSTYWIRVRNFGAVTPNAVAHYDMCPTSGCGPADTCKDINMSNVPPYAFGISPGGRFYMPAALGTWNVQIYSDNSCNGNAFCEFTGNNFRTVSCTTSSPIVTDLN